MTQLVFMRDGRIIFRRMLDKDSLVLGRDPACDIQLSEPEISRQHCRIEKEGDSYTLKDQSRNGTFINGKRVETTALQPGDQIQIGPWRVEMVPDEKAIPSSETVVHKKTKSKTVVSLGTMLGVSDSIQATFALIRKAAETEATVCILGESGTGKELAARSIHDLGARKERPFVALNCGAIPQNLIETLLFGHEKGSFTGAAERHTGVFEEAHTGTLFLDEIGEMPLDLQTRLLRVLETQMVRRVGGKADIRVSVRLIAATHCPLEQMVADGRFRRDLFYRLFIFPIHLAPLRERPDDIAVLARHFVGQFSPADKKLTLSDEALAKLQKHDWPGNVRELKNVIQRAVLMANTDCISSDNILCNPPPEGTGEMGRLKLGDQERLSIIQALEKWQGNQSEAARQLGIARTTLASKLRRYAIDWPRYSRTARS